MKCLVWAACIAVSICPAAAQAHTFGIWRWLGIGFGDGIHAQDRPGEFAQPYSGETVFPAAEPVPASAEASATAAFRATTRSDGITRTWHEEIRLLPPVAK